MKVCVIDDNKSITNLISKFLEMKKHEAVQVNGGRNGLAILESDNFDAVILDLAMPEFSGEMILDELNKSGRIKDHKIVVFTASSVSDEAVERLKEKGAKTVLKKPLEIHSLIDVLESIQK